MKKLDFKKFAFLVLDVVLVIILAGGIFLGFLGYNKTTEAKGCVQVKVTLDQQYHEDALKNKAQKDIEKIFKDAGYELIKDTTIEISQPDNVYNILVFSINGGQAATEALSNTDTTLDGSIFNLIKDYLETNNQNYEFLEDEYRVDLVGGSFANKLLAKNLIAMGIVVVATFIYFIIRFGVKSALASLIATLLEFAFFNAVIVLTRIPVDGMFYVIIYVIMLMSILASLIYNVKFRAALKGVEEKPLQEHAKDVAHCAGKICLSVYAAIIVGLLIAVIVLPTTLKVTFAVLALGTLLVGAVAIFTRPAIRYWLGCIKREKKTGYAVHAKQKENKDK